MWKKYIQYRSCAGENDARSVTTRQASRVDLRFLPVVCWDRQLPCGFLQIATLSDKEGSGRRIAEDCLVSRTDDDLVVRAVLVFERCEAESLYEG